MGISYDASFQQVETGLFGVPLSEPKEMAQYWNCHIHKVSVADMKGDVGCERVKRLHKKRAELVNLEMLSPYSFADSAYNSSKRSVLCFTTK